IHAPSTRRSSRNKNRIPPHSATPSAAGVPGPNRIPVRRPNGSDPIILKKTEAQELAILTRTNTRRNKGSAVIPPLRLGKLAGEVIASSIPLSAEVTVAAQQKVEERILADGEKGVRWNTPLTFFQMESTMIAGSS